MIKPNFYFITGGPGVGKTTLPEELRSRGYQYIEAAARNIIKGQMACNGNALYRIYKESGYNVIGVPHLPVEDRADFILNTPGEK